jgi:hypothetical protein
MSEKVQVFRSPEGEAEYFAAYAVSSEHWPVLSEELCVPTRMGDTHVIAGEPADAVSLILLHPSEAAATI